MASVDAVEDTVQDVNTEEERTPDDQNCHDCEVVYDRLAPVIPETIFRIEEWDSTANIPTVHFSFLLNLLLPKNLISLHSIRIQKDLAQHKRALGQGDMGAVLVGSSAEGYKLPQVIMKSLNSIPFEEQTADFDTLIVWKINPVPEFDRNANPKQKLVLDTAATKPGYVRICINDPETVMQNVDPTFAIQVEDKFYLNAKQQRENLLQVNAQEKLNRGLLVDMQGPAIGLENTLKRTLNLLRSQVVMNDRQEQVVALPCEWPSVAHAWINRNRDNDWLNHSLIKTIVTNGCHVVPVSHKFSTHPDIEWRISFATSEVKLAQTIVTDEQRHCYICLKLLRKQLKERREVFVLSSYHCKTIFLHACEKIPVSAWKENPGACFLHLLDNLITCLENKNLPSFFITENNLIGHYANEEILKTKKLLKTTRDDPISPLLAYCDNRIITGHGVTLNFRKNMDGVLREIKAFQIHRNLSVSVPEFLAAHVMAIQGLLLDNNVGQAAVNLLDNWTCLENMMADMDVADFVIFTLSRWKLVMQLIQVVIEILKNVVKEPEVTKLLNYLGCLYHAASYNFIQGTASFSAAIQKSADTFTKCPQASVDFGVLHYKTGNLDKAKDVLRRFLSSETANKSMMSQYSFCTLITLEKDLRNETTKILQTSGLISIPTVAMARYMLLKCLQKGQTDFLEELQTFEHYCKESSHALSDLLLGIFLFSAKEYGRAYDLFNSCCEKGGSKIYEVMVHVSKVMDVMSYGEEGDALKYLEVYSIEGKYQLVNSIPLCLPKASYAARLMEDTGNYPGFLHGNHACMYHASAYEHDSESEEHVLALVRADTLFATCINEQYVKLSTVVDYAMFLTSQQRWEESIDLLSDKIKSERPCNHRNGYGPIEYHTLDDNLRKEIDIHGVFDAKSFSLAYYLLAKSVHACSKNRYDGIMAEISNFANKEKDSRGFALVGYAYILDERWKKAEHYFCKAVEIAWDYTAAKQNVIECREKAQKLGCPKRDLRKLYAPLAIIPDLEGDYTLDYDRINI